MFKYNMSKTIGIYVKHVCAYFACTLMAVFLKA
jgi:hypothetical protein